MISVPWNLPIRTEGEASTVPDRGLDCTGSRLPDAATRRACDDEWLGVDLAIQPDRTKLAEIVGGDHVVGDGALV